MKWKNGVSCALLACFLLLVCASVALAAPVQVLPSNDEEILLNDKAIFVNGQYLPLNVSTYESGGSVLVPLRAVSTALGAQVQWQNGQVEISLGGTNLLLRPGSAQAQGNGQTVSRRREQNCRFGLAACPTARRPTARRTRTIFTWQFSINKRSFTGLRRLPRKR